MTEHTETRRPSDPDPAGQSLREEHDLEVVHRTDPPQSRLNDSLVLIFSVAAAVGGVVFAATLLLGGPLTLYGGALGAGLLCLGFAIRRYFTDQFPDIEAIESREIPALGDEDEPISDVPQVGDRRRFLTRVLIAAGGVFGLGIVVPPIASLGPAPRNTLLTTAWAPGRRLVTTDGNNVRPADVAGGGIASIWPEGAIGQERSSVLLLRLSGEPEPPTNLDWVVDGSLVAYSKVCTHAGCPVALYRERDEALFCPCHQSTFDTLRGAVPTFGPAARALPQLPLGTDESGFLVALGDFTEPVGPAFA